MPSTMVTSHGLSDQQVSSLNAFVENFYRLTDNPPAHTEYASQYLPSATLIVNHIVVQGEAIRQFRQNLWLLYTSQAHVIENVTYTQKPSTKIGDTNYTAVEAIIFGTVMTVSKGGEEKLLEWAGRADYVSQNNTEWKVARYQVYLNEKPRSDLKI